MNVRLSVNYLGFRSGQVKSADKDSLEVQRAASQDVGALSTRVKDNDDKVRTILGEIYAG